MPSEEETLLRIYKNSNNRHTRISLKYIKALENPYCSSCKKIINSNSSPSKEDWEKFVNCRCVQIKRQEISQTLRDIREARKKYSR